ncbi:MAG: DUF1595 domain-containing protein, partial [Myxococcota bacterium]
MQRCHGMTLPSWKKVLALAIAAASVQGCIGVIGAGDEDTHAGPDDRTGDPRIDVPCDQALSVPMRQLSDRQYANVIGELFGGRVTPSASFPLADRGQFFESFAASTPSTYNRIRDTYVAAEDVALQAVTDLSALLPCAPENHDDACAEQFIREFGRRAFRRPLADEEVVNLLADFR